MLVYGDHARRENPRDVLARLAADLDRLAALEGGIARHGALVGAFIEAGGLLQGLADAQRAGADAPSPAQDAATALLMGLARLVLASWDGGFRTALPLPRAELAALQGLALPEEVEIKVPEGYAFYALYPEAYADAARRLALPGPVRVIGLRSIGTGLAAIAAVALDAPPPATLRPGGHPFRREVALSPELAARLLDDPNADYVVADEGPGLSGSSFGAAADWLESRGVARARVHFLPGHGGDLGPEAAPEHRARWAAARRPTIPFAALIGPDAPPNRRLDALAAPLLGPAAAPLESLSGGAWRALRYDGEARWPAAAVNQERLKFLMRTAEGPWLLKFAGLGREGERKLDRATALAQAGFTAPPRGLVHGFLAERWIEEAAVLDPQAVDRAALVERVGAYLAFRATRFPAEPGRGASLGALLEMTRHNAAEALGPEAGREIEALGRVIPELEARIRPVETDNRMHAHEWLVAPGGVLLKTDALDHHAGHDLVGCQDIAWDLAGAEVELGLGPDEVRSLLISLERRGIPVDPGLLAFLGPAYLAFQMGLCRMAAHGLDWPE